MKIDGVPDEVLKPINDIYNRGYKDGFEDACKQISEMSKMLRESVNDELGKRFGEG